MGSEPQRNLLSLFYKQIKASRGVRTESVEGRIAVQRVQDDLTSVQSLVQRLTNQAPDESSQAEGQLALEDQRTAERKLEESEKRARESAAAVSQLEQSLSKRLTK